MSDFIQEMYIELDNARAKFPAYHSYHEAYMAGHS